MKSSIVLLIIKIFKFHYSICYVNNLINESLINKKKQINKECLEEEKKKQKINVFVIIISIYKYRKENLHQYILYKKKKENMSLSLFFSDDSFFSHDRLINVDTYAKRRGL